MIITERDLRLLKWINAWGAITMTQIASWLGVDFSTAARRIRKLVAAGLLCRLDASGLSVQPIALTQKGCAVASDPLRPLAGIRIATWQHDTMMVDLEPRILRRFSDSVVVPDRRIRLNRALEGTSRRHVPDAIVERSRGGPVAFELELSPKNSVRLQAIIDAYAADREFEAVLYLVPDERMAKHVARFARGLDHIHIRIFRAQTVKE